MSKKAERIEKHWWTFKLTNYLSVSLFLSSVYVLDWVLSVQTKKLSEVNKYIHVFSNEINVVEKICLFWGVISKLNSDRLPVVKKAPTPRLLGGTWRRPPLAFWSGLSWSSAGWPPSGTSQPLPPWGPGRWGGRCRGTASHWPPQTTLWSQRTPDDPHPGRQGLSWPTIKTEVINNF